MTRLKFKMDVRQGFQHLQQRVDKMIIIGFYCYIAFSILNCAGKFYGVSTKTSKFMSWLSDTLLVGGIVFVIVIVFSPYFIRPGQVADVAEQWVLMREHDPIPRLVYPEENDARSL